MPLNVRGATEGSFGPVVQWPLISIHVSLLPDGRVVYYGSDTAGRQNAAMNFAVWDPSLGNTPGAHTLYTNSSGTDVFCSGQSFIASTNQLLLTGGDQSFDGTRNYAVPDVTLFSPDTNSMSRAAQMTQRRWYPSVVAMPDSELVVLGGYSNIVVKGATQYGVASVPEIYSPTAGWRRLESAESLDAYGWSNWFYPRAFAVPGGEIFELGFDGSLYRLNVRAGSIRKLGTTIASAAETLPALQYAPGRILSVRNGGRVQVVETSGDNPVVREAGSLGSRRIWSSLTSMADGSVLLSGGSEVDGVLEGATRQSMIWNPDTNSWKAAATGAFARMYHSNALLLPDATVIISGGGAPGPLVNTNGELYYPPYLYRKDGSGLAAARPYIVDAPARSSWGSSVALTVRSTEPVRRLTLVRHGSATHSYNSDQRFIELPFRMNGERLEFDIPADRSTVIPGYYMIFAIDSQGTPSISRTIRIDG